MFIQCWYRMRFARRVAAATKLQAALRMQYASRSYKRIRSSALIIQVSSVHPSLPIDSLRPQRCVIIAGRLGGFPRVHI